MHPSDQKFCLNLEASEDYPNTQYYQNPFLFPNTSQVQTSQNYENQSRGTKWDVAEDITLMSAWCITSENSTIGKNQKISKLWARVKKMYDAAQAENPEKLSLRNVAQIKGRFKRLNENGEKWVVAYREADHRKRSGMSQKDIESEAHKLYEQDKESKFIDHVVFIEVMCKHPKWDLQINHDTTCSRPEEYDEESGGSSKRTRTTEEGDYYVNPNPDTPSGGGSITERPTGRDAAKRKGKGIGLVSTDFVEDFTSIR